VFFLTQKLLKWTAERIGTNLTGQKAKDGRMEDKVDKLAKWTWT
jgi:hypothetical protein